MQIMGMGLDFTGERLFPAHEEQAFAKFLIGALERNAETVRALTQTTTATTAFRSEVERQALDVGDPRAVGWTFLVHEGDPRLGEIIETLKPLAEHRGMADPNNPLRYYGEPFDEWMDWLNDYYFALELETGQIPGYILIVGGPERIPFGFQAVLDTVANVGRIDLETTDDLKTYVDKLIRLETTPDPVVSREAVLFAPDAGLPDPTYFSRRYMVEPLAEHIRDTLAFETRTVLGDAATKAALCAALEGRQPALVYTASHGLGARSRPFAFQKQYNGAICCRHGGGPLTLDTLYSADDVSHDQPFLEGAVFFQFACFGYGTPAQSDFAHWLDGVPQQYTEADFVAALPRKLLAHPRGPIAYIGHLDTAFLHGFADVEDPHIFDRWHTRIAPFVKVVNQLLAVQPSGLAMEEMNKRYGVCNALITNTYDRQKRGKMRWNERLQNRFVNTWITRGDAQNYFVFGDPAARLRIPES